MVKEIEVRARYIEGYKVGGEGYSNLPTRAPENYILLFLK